MENLVQADIPGIRKVLKTLGIITAEVDKELRYKWMYNPHPDFDPEKVIGKRDDELIPKEDAEEIISFKKRVFESGETVKKTLLFNRSNGPCYYNLTGYPVKNAKGQVVSILTLGFYSEPQKGS